MSHCHNVTCNSLHLPRCLPKEWLTPNALEATLAETRGASASNAGNEGLHNLTSPNVNLNIFSFRRDLDHRSDQLGQ